MKKERMPAYLANLNSGGVPDDILLDGKDYLQGLPLGRRRSSKRQRPSPPPTTSLFHRIKYATSRLGGTYFEENSKKMSAILLSASVILVLGFSVKRWRSTERSESPTKHKQKEKKRRRKKSKKKHISDMSNEINTTDGLESEKSVTMSLTLTNNEQSDDVKLKEVAIVVTACHEHVEITKSQENEITSTIPKDHLRSNGIYGEEAVPVLTSSHSGNQDSLDINLNSQVKFPTKEIASRWESLGLGRQKSLELAANAEMNWYFYQEMKQTLSSVAVHLFDQLGWHVMQILYQSEKHHRERLNAPEIDMLRKRRHEVKYSLLNKQLQCRCFCVALAARFARHDNLVSLTNAVFGTILSNLCAGCNTPMIRDSMNNFAYYDLYSWRKAAYNLIESMSSAWFCVGRLIFCSICLGIMHCVSKKLTFALIASTLIPWREIIVTSVLVVAINCLLTLIMLKQCSIFDQGSEGTGGNAAEIAPRQVTDQYKQKINIYRVLAYLASACIGLFCSNFSID